MSAAALEDLRAAVGRAAAALGGTPKAPPTLERPRQADHGDYATNAALMLAGAMRAKPRDVADRLADAVRAELDGDLARVDVAGPGFLNLSSRTTGTCARWRRCSTPAPRSAPARPLACAR